jgi:hypothetical protein
LSSWGELQTNSSRIGHLKGIDQARLARDEDLKEIGPPNIEIDLARYRRDDVPGHHMRARRGFQKAKLGCRSQGVNLKGHDVAGRGGARMKPPPQSESQDQRNHPEPPKTPSASRRRRLKNGERRF